MIPIPNKMHMSNGILLAVGLALTTIIILGIVTIAAIFSMSKVLDSVENVSTVQSEQAQLSACRSQISQEIQEGFRKQLGVALDALDRDDRQRLRAVINEINHTPSFEDRVKTECVVP